MEYNKRIILCSNPLSREVMQSRNQWRCGTRWRLSNSVNKPHHPAEIVNQSQGNEDVRSLAAKSCRYIYIANKKKQGQHFLEVAFQRPTYGLD